MAEMSYDDYVALTTTPTPDHEWDERFEPGYDPGPMRVDTRPAELACRLALPELAEVLIAKTETYYREDVAPPWEIAAQAAQLMKDWSGTEWREFFQPYLHVAHRQFKTGHNVRHYDDTHDEFFAGAWECREYIQANAEMLATACGHAGHGEDYALVFDIFNTASYDNSYDVWSAWVAIRALKDEPVEVAAPLYLEAIEFYGCDDDVNRPIRQEVSGFAQQRFSMVFERLALFAFGESKALDVIKAMEVLADEAEERRLAEREARRRAALEAYRACGDASLKSKNALASILLDD